MLNDLYFKTTCNKRPHFLGPMGGLKLEGQLLFIKAYIIYPSGQESHLSFFFSTHWPCKCLPQFGQAAFLKKKNCLRQRKEGFKASLYCSLFGKGSAKNILKPHSNKTSVFFQFCFWISWSIYHTFIRMNFPQLMVLNHCKVCQDPDHLNTWL